MKHYYDTNEELEIRKNEAEFSRGMFRGIFILCVVILFAFNQGALEWTYKCDDGRTDTIYTLADNSPPVVIKAKSKAQQKQVDYIYAHLEDAGRESKQCGVPVSIILAQAITESASGTSWVARTKHNHFGIIQGKSYKRYNSVASCWDDYSRVLNLDYYDALKGCDNVKDWADGMEKIYAEKPGYSDTLIQLIQQYNLTEYDESPRPLKGSTVDF